MSKESMYILFDDYPGNLLRFGPAGHVFGVKSRGLPRVSDINTLEGCCPRLVCANTVTLEHIGNKIIIYSSRRPPLFWQFKSPKTNANQ